MAIVLAIVILGWLVAFALGAQEGFENEPTAAPVKTATPDATASQPSSYKDPLSAS